MNGARLSKNTACRITRGPLPGHSGGWFAKAENSREDPRQTPTA